MDLNGRFETVDAGVLSLFKQGEKFILQYNTHRIEIDKDTRAKLIVEEPNSRLQISYRNEIVLDVMYTPDTASVIPGDPTAFVEDEDFDFGLYCENVINDPERQQRMYRHGR